MPYVKYVVGEAVEVLCHHMRDGQRVHDWLAGTVIQADYRMAGVQFNTDVYSSNGHKIPDRTLWCTHGSRNIRRRSSGPD